MAHKDSSVNYQNFKKGHMDLYVKNLIEQYKSCNPEHQHRLVVVKEPGFVLYEGTYWLVTVSCVGFLKLIFIQVCPQFRSSPSYSRRAQETSIQNSVEWSPRNSKARLEKYTKLYDFVLGLFLKPM